MATTWAVMARLGTAWAVAPRSAAECCRISVAIWAGLAAIDWPSCWEAAATLAGNAPGHPDAIIRFGTLNGSKGTSGLKSRGGRVLESNGWTRYRRWILYCSPS